MLQFGIKVELNYDSHKSDTKLSEFAKQQINLKTYLNIDFEEQIKAFKEDAETKVN
jgi:hypothetical protein